MRSVFAILVCCGLLSLAGCAGGPAGKLSDCRRDDALLAGVPVGWTGGGTDLNLFRVGLDTGEAHGGEASLSVFSDRAGRENWMQLSQVIEAGEFAGQRVRFRAFVKVCGVNSGAALWMRADSKTRRALAFDNMYRRKIKGSTGWSPYEVVLDIPADCHALHYGVLLEGRGQVWIDDCSLEVAGPEAFVTASNVGKSYARKYVTRPSMQSYPANLDFEAKVPGN